MGIFEQIVINSFKESDWIDYKMKINFIDNKVDFLRDIVAFANNQYKGNQYIVYGIKEEGDHLDLVGLDNIFDEDDASYQQLVYEKIEPVINISFSRHKHNDKDFLVLTIVADKTQQPFMFKSRYSNIEPGESWIRIGSSKRRMLRGDFDNVYNNIVLPINVSLRDKELFINDQNPANLEIIIKNYSHIDRLFTSIFLLIEDEKGNELTIIKMHAFKTKSGYQSGTFASDFTLSVPKQSEISGIGEFSFSSSQAIVVGLDEYGESETRYVFKLVFRYDENKEYSFNFTNCTIFAKGAVLWKIQKHAKETKTKRRK